jgi:hypothetical protein
MPSGDVAPMAGMVAVLCAWPGPQLIRIAVVKTKNRFIELSYAALRRWRTLDSVKHGARLAPA